MRLGTRFETKLAGQHVAASVREFEPTTRIAWGGGPKADGSARAYHAWIITPTQRGTHLWTEETMQGPLWLELAKPAPDIFWRTHETLLPGPRQGRRRTRGCVKQLSRQLRREPPFPYPSQNRSAS